MIGEPQNEQECAEDHTARPKGPHEAVVELGLTVLGPSVDRSGIVVAVPYGSPRLAPLRTAGYTLAPTGPRYTIVGPVVAPKLSGDETRWVGVVNAPQGLLNYQHRFEGETPSDVLRSAADALDLTGAKKVTVAIERVALEDSPKIADLLARYREAREAEDESTERASALRAELAALGIDAEARR